MNFLQHFEFFRFKDVSCIINGELGTGRINEKYQTQSEQEKILQKNEKNAN